METGDQVVVRLEVRCAYADAQPDPGSERATDVCSVKCYIRRRYCFTDNVLNKIYL
jgi:hypothetical protein